MTALEVTKNQIKGTAFNNLKKFITHELGSDQYTRLASSCGIRNPNLIIPSSWYPFDQYHMLSIESSIAMGKTFRDFIIDSTLFLIVEDLNGVYRFFIRVATPRRVLEKLPSMSRTYVNFVEYKVLENKDGYHSAQLTIPKEVRDWELYSAEGGIRGILTVCNRSIKSWEIGDESEFTGTDGIITRLVLEVTY